MSEFRDVEFSCVSKDGATYTIRGADPELLHTIRECGAKSSVLLDRDQVRELVTRLTEWLGDAPPTPAKWTDL